MNRYLVSLFVLLFLNSSSSSFAQNYIPFPDSGATWVNTHYLLVGNPPFFHQQLQAVDYYCATGEDTIINSLIYSKIFYCDSTYEAAIRDNGNGIVYIVPKDSSSEYILYDFSAIPGDTIVNVYCKFGPAWCWNGLSDYIISSVDSILIGNMYRKRIHMNSGGRWIEGIGNAQGLFWESGANVSMYSLHLHCFSLNDTTFFSEDIYINPTPDPVACSFDVGIDDNIFDQSFVQVYPNPAENIIYVISEIEKNKLIELFDATGKLLYSFESTQLNTLVNTHKLEPGIYFIKVIIDNDTFIQKLIKN